ncbi:MAG: hypothetical protein MI757_16305, partial [Pirellulales bacterium]|nr:hypothetical protein [Pirellulales bacterium]
RQQLLDVGIEVGHLQSVVQSGDGQYPMLSAQKNPLRVRLDESDATAGVSAGKVGTAPCDGCHVVRINPGSEPVP